MWRQWALVAILGLAAGTGGVFLGKWLGDAGSSSDQGGAAFDGSAAKGKERPAFELPGLDGNTYHVSRWDGRVVLLNFWATWCAPCREEMPMLDELQARYGDQGLQVVGVALDTPGAVQAFTEKLGVDYPILVDGATGDDLMRRYGNTQGVLPYSVLIGRNGTIRDAIYGVLERKPLERRLDALL